MIEVFVTFLKLGLTSFGGPIAHLGYFHREIVERRRWLDEARYAQLVALCQFLPGPASSQVGFSIGLIRAGWMGAMAAFVAFTLPSAVLLVGFAHVLPQLNQPVGQAAIHGLKLVAVAVVAQGVVAMAWRLTPDAPRRLIAIAAAMAVLISGSAVMQVIVVIAGALIGLASRRDLTVSDSPAPSVGYGRRTGAILLVTFGVLLLLALLPWPNNLPRLVSLSAALYRAGALVFGGGHVVLPLLEKAVTAPGWVSLDEFLAGYGAAQAVPGPLFSFAAFLGARLSGEEGGLLGASVSLVAIFLPGFLLVAGALPFWSTIAHDKRAASALTGVNASVVGLLGAALYDPLWISAVLTPLDFAIALIAFGLLYVPRVPVLLVFTLCVLASIARSGSAM